MIRFFLIFLISILGQNSSLYLQRYAHFSAVLASALPTLGLALFLLLLPQSLGNFWLEELPLIFFGASFAGMSQAHRLPNLPSQLVSALIFAALFFAQSQFFKGYGGALGTSACIAVLGSTALQELYAYGKKKWNP
ncbi:hypothetical protein SapgrDRAFT_0501 [Saprospira grandis DSM 2844]|uniref:Uncharacterized protein n=1 Tax=Saprospira grandis DSM 2844 TaxID=694433 RepID=J1I0R1_9BACT|nr:hypothetical protein [Saprospira grandis]EJF52245.1 hypothetical protein SapgrDRAFT_0501 [Saprospira grandis DSM 2844]